MGGRAERRARARRAAARVASTGAAAYFSAGCAGEVGPNFCPGPRPKSPSASPSMATRPTRVTAALCIGEPTRAAPGAMYAPAHCCAASTNDNDDHDTMVASISCAGGRRGVAAPAPEVHRGRPQGTWLGHHTKNWLCGRPGDDISSSTRRDPYGKTRGFRADGGAQRVSFASPHANPDHTSSRVGQPHHSERYHTFMWSSTVVRKRTLEKLGGDGRARRRRRTVRLAAESDTHTHTHGRPRGGKSGPEARP